MTVFEIWLRGQSAKDLAEKLRITKRTIVRWRTGESLPNRGNIKTIEELSKGAVKAKDIFNHYEKTNYI